MAKQINKSQMKELMTELYPKDDFDVAVNKAKESLYITVLNKQGKKKYLVNDNLV